MPADRPIPVSHQSPQPPSINVASYPSTSSEKIILNRNQAWKVRCDALRPGCTPCKKSARVKKEDPEAVVCTYDEQTESPTNGNSKPPRVRGVRKVNALENKIAELEQLIRSSLPQQVQQPPPPRPSVANAPPHMQANPSQPYPQAYTASSWPSTSPPPPPPSSFAFNPPSSTFAPPAAFSFAPQASLPSKTAPPPSLHSYSPTSSARPPMGSSSRTSDAHPPSARDSSALATLAQAADSVFELDPLSTLESVERHDSFDAGSLGDFLGTSASRRVSAHVGGASNMSTFDASLPDSLLQLLYPGWSSDLPNPTLVKSLCVLYFEADSCARGLINRSKFMTSLSLPPSHPRFPSTALLHAICGIACLYMTATSDPLGVWNEGFWTIEATPSDYFLKLAKLHIDEATVKCTKLFEAAQAAILVCFSSYAKARFIEVWLYTGLATRIATPLGLNHLEGVCASRNATKRGSASVKAAMLEPPVDEAERYERAMTMWLAFCCDRFASANTGWSMSIAEEDVTTLLPNEATRYVTSLPDISRVDSLDFRSPIFFSSHPPQLVRSTGMLIKSVILLSRINCFLQRSPYPIGSRTGEQVDGEIPDLRDTPAFKRLDADTVAFRLSFPRDLRHAFESDGSDTNIETNLILAHQVAHTATILLHEVWCTTELNDPSMQRCMQSASAILRYLSHKTASRTARLNPFIAFCWSVAGRTLVRQKAIFDHQKNEVSSSGMADRIRATVDGLIQVAGSPLAYTCAETLRQLFDNAEAMLPDFRIKKSGETRIFAPLRPEDLRRSTQQAMDVDAPPEMAPTGPRGMATGMAMANPFDQAASAFLLSIEQKHSDRTMTAQELRDLLDPWVEGTSFQWPVTPGKC